MLICRYQFYHRLHKSVRCACQQDLNYYINPDSARESCWYPDTPRSGR